MSGFLLTHMAGNLLILCGPESYNKYSHALITNPFLPLAELGLVALFVVHVYFALALAVSNRRAKGQRHEVQPPHCSAKASSFAVKTMVYTGLVTFAFLVLHLITFKWGAHYSATYGGVEMRDLHRLVLEKFQEPLYVGWYCFALLVLGLHLSHGVSGLFQSLGLASVRNCAVKKLGWAFAILITAGFIVQPIYCLVWGGPK